MTTTDLSEIRTVLADGRARFDAAWRAFEAIRDKLVADPATAGRWVVFDGVTVHHVAVDKRAAHRWGMLHLGPTAGFIVAFCGPKR